MRAVIPTATLMAISAAAVTAASAPIITAIVSGTVAAIVTAPEGGFLPEGLNEPMVGRPALGGGTVGGGLHVCLLAGLSTTGITGSSTPMSLLVWPFAAGVTGSCTPMSLLRVSQIINSQQVAIERRATPTWAAAHTATAGCFQFTVVTGLGQL